MKIKSLIQIVIISYLGFASTAYSQSIVYCAALRISRAYEKSDISEKHLEELYYLWKDNLKSKDHFQYSIDTYEDFKIIFGLGKKSCSTQADCNEGLEPLFPSFTRYLLNYYCDDDLDELIDKCSQILGLQNSQKEDL